MVIVQLVYSYTLGVGLAFWSVIQFCIFQALSIASYLWSQGRSLIGHLIFCPILTHRPLSDPIRRSGWIPKWGVLCNPNLDLFLKCCLSELETWGPGSTKLSQLLHSAQAIYRFFCIPDSSEGLQPRHGNVRFKEVSDSKLKWLPDISKVLMPVPRGNLAVSAT